jgi:hypothetical protein
MPLNCATTTDVFKAACTKTAQCARRISSIQPRSAAYCAADTRCIVTVSVPWFSLAPHTCALLSCSHLDGFGQSHQRVRASGASADGQLCWEQVNKSHLARCPLCAVSITESAGTWAQMDAEIARSPMPEEYRNKQEAVLCNDCHATSSTAFHVLGLKCISCGSYNTRKR